METSAVLSKRPSPCKHPPTNFNSSRVLRGPLSYHSKSLHGDCRSTSQFLHTVIELTYMYMYIAAIILMCFRCHDNRQQRFTHTGLWSRLQHSSLTAQIPCTASGKRCRRLAARLQVGPFSSTKSFLYRWACLVWLNTKHGQRNNGGNFRFRGGYLHGDG